MYRNFLKRLFDLALSGASLIALSPLMLLTALCIKAEDHGSALFIQQRSGRGGVPFRLFKFRSMPVNSAHVPSSQARSLRVTRVGKIIRRMNIDELPQLLNIFRGDMSIVGPRPALPGQIALLEMRRANGAVGCKPGLTGLAQVNSYDNMPEAEKARWDGIYASKVSFINDLKVILKTFVYLTRRPPVY